MKDVMYAAISMWFGSIFQRATKLLARLYTVSPCLMLFQLTLFLYYFGALCILRLHTVLCFLVIVFFIPEFKKMVEEESYLHDQVLNTGMTGLSSSSAIAMQSMLWALVNTMYHLKC